MNAIRAAESARTGRPSTRLFQTFVAGKGSVQLVRWTNRPGAGRGAAELIGAEAPRSATTSGSTAAKRLLSTTASSATAAPAGLIRWSRSVPPDTARSATAGGWTHPPRAAPAPDVSGR